MGSRKHLAPLLHEGASVASEAMARTGTRRVLVRIADHKRPLIRIT